MSDSRAYIHDHWIFFFLFKLQLRLFETFQPALDNQYYPVLAILDRGSQRPVLQTNLPLPKRP